jgi:hypothetical protein
VAIARSRREHLQRIIGDRGLVQPFVAVPDLRHRGIGWYVLPAEAIADCDCEFCEAASGERELFLATGSFLAATLLHTYAIEHPMREQQVGA